MIVFNTQDFNIKNQKQKKEVRNKLDKLGAEFVKSARIVCPNRQWGHYVTGKSAYEEEWGAVFPFNVKGNEEFIALYPNVFYNIPQNSSNLLVAANIEFKNPREMLLDKCSPQNINRLLSQIQSATNAQISIRRKEVLRSDKRDYIWTSELWEEKILPDIDVALCSVEYLNNLQQTIQMPCKQNPKDINYLYEPFILIKYEFDIYTLISNSNVEALLLDKIRLLTPLVDYISS